MGGSAAARPEIGVADPETTDAGATASTAGACGGTDFSAGSVFACGAGWKTTVPPGPSLPERAVRVAAAGLVARGVAVPGVGMPEVRYGSFVTVPSACRRNVFPHLPHRIDRPL